MWIWVYIYIYCICYIHGISQVKAPNPAIHGVICPLFPAWAFSGAGCHALKRLKHPIASLVAKLSARNRAQGPVTPGVKDLRLRMIQQWYINDTNDISMIYQWCLNEIQQNPSMWPETVVHLGMRDFRQHLRGWTQGFPGRGVLYGKKASKKKKERKVYDRNVIYVVSYDFTILVGGVL